jgi:hypothetical protein
MRRAVVIAALAACTLAFACSDTSSSKPASPAAATTPPAATPSQPPPSSAPVPARNEAAVPAEFRELWKMAFQTGKAGDFQSYTYKYAAAGERAAAVMIPRPIPRDDTILVGTISDLTQRAFKANLSKATPHVEPTPQGNAIVFRVPRYTYYVLTIKNETQEGAYGPGEPHTLLVWRKRH